MMGFKAFHSAQATIAGIYTFHPCAKIYLYFVSESELLQQWLAHNG
jgi:hypothetical protein